MASKNVKGIFWSFVERLCSQASNFVIGIVLARLLTPKDYGTIGLITIFIYLSNVFVDSGFCNALIRKQNRSPEDCSTAFYFNVIVGAILYLTLFFLAPGIAKFFDTPILIPLTRIVALSVLFASFCLVQRSLLVAKLDIKAITKITLSSQIPAGLIAIVMAYYGFGVYSLAIQQVGSQLLIMIQLWLVSKWRPTLNFKKKSFEYLWGFGSKLTAASFIGVLFEQIYAFIIGKYISKKELGYYSKAQSLAGQPNQIVSGVIQRVVLPAFSVHQDNLEQLKAMYRKYVRNLFFVTVPLACLLFIISKPLVVILWGDKWLPAVPIFRCLLIAGLLSPLSQLNLGLLQVLGRTDLTLRLEFVKKPLYAIVIAVAFRFGLNGVLAALIINNIIACLVNAYPSKRLIGYSYWVQFGDVFRYMLCGMPIMAATFLLPDFFGNEYLGTAIKGFLFCGCYLTIMKFKNDTSLKETWSMVRSLLCSKKH